MENADQNPKSPSKYIKHFIIVDKKSIFLKKPLSSIILGPKEVKKMYKFWVVVGSISCSLEFLWYSSFWLEPFWVNRLKNDLFQNIDKI